MFSLYASKIKHFGPNPSVGAIVYSITETVTAVDGFGSDTQQESPDETQIEPPNNFLAYEDGKVVTDSLPVSGQDSTFASLFTELNLNGPEIKRNDTSVIDKDNKILMGLSMYPSLSATNKFALLYRLIQFEARGVIRNQIWRLIGGDSYLPIVPAEDTTDRGIKESELLNFTNLTPAEAHMYKQLIELDEIIKGSSDPLPNFTGLLKATAGGDDRHATKRKFYRKHSALSFAQILSAEMQREPTTFRKYYPLTDQLLYCLIWPPPNRRMLNETVKLHELISASTFSQIQKTGRAKPATRPGSSNAKSSRPASSKSQKSSRPTSADGLNTVIEKLTITPADRAIMRVSRSSSTTDSWLCMYVGDSVVGFRKADSYRAFGDESRPGK
jgi:hypothetical protein